MRHTALLIGLSPFLFAAACAVGVDEPERGDRSGKEDQLAGSCDDACGGQALDGDCWCDTTCGEFGDCCQGKLDACPHIGNTCVQPGVDADGDGRSGCDDPQCRASSPCLNAEGEILEPGEEDEFVGNGQEINAIQLLAAETGEHEIRRGFHNKSHACLRAEFHVPDDIPAAVRVGPLFQDTGRSFDAWVRFSNGSPFFRHDLAGDFRGFAFKVVGVGGPKLAPGAEHGLTQDFLMLNNPFMAAPSARTFMDFVRASTMPETKQFCLGGVCISQTLYDYLMDPDHAHTRNFVLLRVLLRVVWSMRGKRFWSGSTFKFGATTMRYSVRPCQGGWRLPTSSDYLRRDLVDHLQSGELCYDFYVQLATDDVDPATGEPLTPVEDAAAEWTEEAAPPIRAGRLIIPRTDLDSCEARKMETFCNQLRFTPWNTAPEYRPLGSINRVRKAVYEASQGLRDGRLPEPDGTEAFDCQ
jgi:hypothetical protein